MAKKKPGSYEIRLSAGLESQDHNIETLSRLFEQLQVATVETADPHLDLITFATTAYYFAVILEFYVPAPPDPDTEDEDELKAMARRTKLSEKATKEKAKMERLLKAYAKRKGSNKPGSSKAPTTPRVSHPFMAGLSPAVSSPAPKNDWRSYGYSEAIEISMSPVTDSPLFSERYQDNRENLPGEFEPRWKANPSSSFLSPLPMWPDNEEKAVGMVYLTSSHNIEDPLHVGELNIGIILAEEARGKGYARRAIDIVSQKAFEEAKCHRLQANLLNHVAKDRALCLFTEMRFGHEGTRRRSFFSPMEFEWKDVTCMAILDTDWVLNRSRGLSSTVRSAPKSLWDELFARHERERQELLRWESSSSTLKRSSSTATLRAASPIPTAPPLTSESEAESEMSDSSSSRPLFYSKKGKEKADTTVDVTQPRSLKEYDMSSDSDADLDPPNEERMLSSPTPESPNPFTDDEEMSQGGYDSVTSWDALDIPSSSSSDDASDSDDSSTYDFIYHST